MSESGQSNKEKEDEIIDTDTSKSSSSSKQRYLKVKDFADKSTTKLWKHIQGVYPTVCEGKEEKVSSQNNSYKRPTIHCCRKSSISLCLNPIANIPSADTLRRDLNTNFEHIKGTVQHTLQEAPGLLSFTLDAWTSKNQLLFLGISVHWIDKEWNLKCSTLDFCFLSGPHSGENFANKFFDVLQDFNIVMKLLAISCDNAANMNIMLKKLSILLLEKNINFDLTTNLPELELISDIITQWNSTELMLERILKLKKALYNATLTDKDLAKYKLADNKWIIINEIHKLMQKTLSVTNVLTEWKIHSKDLKIKYNLITSTLAIMYNNNLTCQSNIKHKIMEGQLLMIQVLNLQIWLGINTKGHKPNWFKRIEQHCIINIVILRKVKPEFIISRQYCLQVSVLIQCTSCELKDIQSRSKRKSDNNRCLLFIDKEKTIDVKAQSIQNAYILDTSVFEYIAMIKNRVKYNTIIGSIC
ncbi:zinc finger BED domain-containing protein RICESLEEPER 2-like [Rhizophagus clarus]|uniref:Zinc finger BED domain-containing protein RICESLEEPER 2-like n=1 Tax=Rhizophagus clarus TaxID=94130 RepID=A0A8H3QRL5_9GLOM|nr:zinc finger BED domain-containing protein RICESLEEPER 2-like [Rhizophagus clarus]